MMPSRDHSARGRSGINSDMRGTMVAVDLDWLAAHGNRAQRRYASEQLRQIERRTAGKGGRHE